MSSILELRSLNYFFMVPVCDLFSQTFCGTFESRFLGFHAGKFGQCIL
ncbi:unnamed protein product [Larinioides sclopetarius]|uniref:Uncharacterized protein n=1 Tax=Larinioides sclopetarius TaxID=280406 RepID=A0AAV2BXF3_9ARAC